VELHDDDISRFDKARKKKKKKPRKPVQKAKDDNKEQ
jgi:hypothetical protein